MILIHLKELKPLSVPMRKSESVEINTLPSIAPCVGVNLKYPLIKPDAISTPETVRNASADSLFTSTPKNHVIFAPLPFRCIRINSLKSPLPLPSLKDGGAASVFPSAPGPF